MEQKNIVIGIEGTVGAGKTSICRELLKEIDNSIILHGGNIYRAIVYGMANKNLASSENIDAFEIMKKLGIEIKLENRETVIYMNNKKISEEDLQAEKTSINVSKISNKANNEKLYEFGKELINSFREKYNIILSSRDIIKMYPDTTYHFFVTADLETRTKRKYNQYNKEISEAKIEEMIKQRDELQEKSGYYKIYPQTKVIDVTDCENVEESAEKILKNIKETITNGI